jgi:hypothetical protein
MFLDQPTSTAVSALTIQTVKSNLLSYIMRFCTELRAAALSKQRKGHAISAVEAPRVFKAGCSSYFFCSFFFTHHKMIHFCFRAFLFLFVKRRTRYL